MASSSPSRRRAPAALLALALALALTAPAPASSTPSGSGGASAAEQCRPFSSIYADGKALCEKIFTDSFEYVPYSSPNYDSAYTMWSSSLTNPNDAITARRLQKGLMKPAALAGYPGGYTGASCYLEGYHKPQPAPEDAPLCYPYQSNACCVKDTVASPAAINSAYGSNFRWDRCGKLSYQCEAFFIQEACLYECDQNAGFYRKFPPATYNASDPDQNTWQMYKMPIKAEYCDAWFAACRDDLFCGENGGDFFSCAKVAQQASNDAAQPTLAPGAIAGIVIASVVLVALAAFLGFVIYRERSGVPVFSKLPSADAKPILAGEPATSAGQAAAGERNQIQNV